MFFNFVRNWLEHEGYQVEYVYNFTDVDDKIIHRAQSENVLPQVVSERFIAEFKKDFAALNLRPHDHNPKVTEYIPAIIKSIQKLIEKNHAYVVEGEVLYAVRSFTNYGKLSGRNPDDLLSGARVEVDPKKRDPLDFALWKPALADELGWDSPWGKGRPGWHIECTSMIQSLLGDQIDIHAGGSDLIFPHHENEIAQGEGCTQKTYAKYWLHNNMFTFGGQKMSKSLGNIKTMRSFLENFDAEIFKYMVLSVHYRSLAEFTEDTIQQAIQALARIYSALALAQEIINSGSNLTPQSDPTFEELIKKSESQMILAANDDFGTPRIMAEVFDLIRGFNQRVKRGVPAQGKMLGCAHSFREFVLRWGGLFSLFNENPAEYLRQLDDRILDQKGLKRAEIDRIIQQRALARAGKDFAKSDEYRNQLSSLGIEVQDIPGRDSFWEVRK